MCLRCAAVIMISNTGPELLPSKSLGSLGQPQVSLQRQESISVKFMRKNVYLLQAGRSPGRGQGPSHSSF